MCYLCLLFFGADVGSVAFCQFWEFTGDRIYYGLDFVLSKQVDLFRHVHAKIMGGPGESILVFCCSLIGQANINCVFHLINKLPDPPLKFFEYFLLFVHDGRVSKERLKQAKLVLQQLEFMSLPTSQILMFSQLLLQCLQQEY